jgi:16S rRNA (cytosine1402-N4)-methyltransferase
MLQETIEGLTIDPKGVYVDVTFGGGGHSAAIMAQLDGGKLYAFDQDADAKENAASLIDDGMTFIPSNFKFVRQYLKMYGVSQVDGILADLGVSSHQFDVAERGFSTRFNAALDMRMDQSTTLSAYDVINTYSASELMIVLSNYGEVRNSRTLANAIVSARTAEAIKHIDQFKDILKKYAKRGKQNQYYAQVFQAIRIEVNDEMKALEDMLEQGTELLKPGGYFVAMSYHSLEDRLVKNYFNKGNFQGETIQDFYGNLIRPLEPLNRKPIMASPEELIQNPRARSAKLRIAKKIKDGTE